MAQPNLAQYKNEFDKLELDRFHNARLADKIQASRLLASRFGAANTNREIDDAEAPNISQEIPEYRQRRQRNKKFSSIPNDNQRLDSPQHLDSLVEGLNAKMTEEQGREYGERLGAYLNKKISQGSFAAISAAFFMALIVDILDGGTSIATDLLPIISTAIEWLVEHIFFIAIILIIRKDLSFFKRMIFRRLVFIFVGTITIEAIPFIESFSPTYSLMIVYVWHKRRKEIKKLSNAHTKVKQVLKQQLTPQARKKMANYIQKTKLAT